MEIIIIFIIIVYYSWYCLKISNRKDAEISAHTVGSFYSFLWRSPFVPLIVKIIRINI